MEVLGIPNHGLPNIKQMCCLFNLG